MKFTVRIESEAARLAKRFNIPIKLAKLIPNKNPARIKVKDFPIYDVFNLEDPLVIEMNALLAENPTYEKIYWQQSGPCSNWGYEIWRLETEEEYNSRILKEINRVSKMKPEKNSNKYDGIDFGVESINTELSSEVISVTNKYS